MSNSLKEQYASSPLFGLNAAAVEAMYEQFLSDPDSVSDSWRRYFRTLGDRQGEIPHSPVVRQLKEASKVSRGLRGNGKAGAVRTTGPSAASEKQAAVSRLIQVYSLRGHQIADIDPLGLMERPVPGVLKLDYLGLTEADMETEFFTGGLAGTGNRRMKLR